MPEVSVKIVQLDKDLPLPKYAMPGDAGADLASRIDVTIQPGERVLVPTGVAIELPEGFVAFVHPRSGLAARLGLSIVNTPGTIDSGYRGEIKVCLWNTDRKTPIEIRRGDLIAQLVLQQVFQAKFIPVDRLTASHRGLGGYGSTGGVSSWVESAENTSLGEKGE